MKVLVIGLGLIGGSMAWELRKQGHSVTGADASAKNAETARNRGLVDGIATPEAGMQGADLIVIAVPVDAAVRLLPGILDRVEEGQTVIDLGSTKAAIVAAAEGHPARARFVACHPMAGTEFSGPEAAVEGLYAGRFTVICNKDESDPDALATAERLFETLGMKTVYYNAEAHDMHAAFVSHISHITSFALALTVLDKEKNEKDIFSLAAGGFTSTVRLAKSAPHTWVPIFKQNKKYLLDVLDAQTEKLRLFREAIESDSDTDLHALIEEANEIKRIL
ncbi:MAG: prephenate dehydrogenase [Flavobacteriales bacterium]|nr:prephenate dehydrogenase [Flavobacteriales bacterium]